MVRIRISDMQINAALDGLDRRLGDLSPAYKAIGELLIREIDDQFRAEGTMAGQPWAPLARATLERKAKQKRILKILQSRGILRASVSYRAGARSVLVGFATPYAQYHQFGSNKLPRRLLLPSEGLPPRVGDAIAAIVTDFLDGD